MKYLSIGLLLLLSSQLSAPLAGIANAQDVALWNAPATDDQTPVANYLTYGQAVAPWWASGELLVWWTKASPSPVPLVTIAPGSAAGNPLNNGPPGALGNPDTTILFGGRDISNPAQLGGRFTLGRWLDDQARSGIEANFLFLDKSTVSQSAVTDGSQWLTSPFTDNVILPAFPDSLPLIIPGVASGSAVFSSIRQVYGAELNGVWFLREGNGLSWHLLGGYRFLNVNEELSLETTFRFSDPALDGRFSNTIDQFQTRNYFNGGQLGIRGEWVRGNWFFGSTIKVALGSTHEVVDIRGATTTDSGPGFNSTIPVTTVPGGIYAQPTNIGQSSRDVFAVLPEVTLRVGAQVTARVRMFVGYNFLYLSSVARPGNQIDGTINVSQMASAFGEPPPGLGFGSGLRNPAPRFQSSDFWAQGLTFGAEIAW